MAPMAVLSFHFQAECNETNALIQADLAQKWKKYGMTDRCARGQDRPRGGQYYDAFPRTETKFRPAQSPFFGSWGARGTSPNIVPGRPVSVTGQEIVFAEKIAASVPSRKPEPDPLPSLPMTAKFP